MKKVIVGILCLVALGLGYFVYGEFTENQNLKEKISDKSDLILKNDKEKEAYESKKSELDTIKERNKDKASKYDEVEAWNQEIIKYLD